MPPNEIKETLNNFERGDTRILKPSFFWEAMKRVLFRGISLTTHNFLHSCTKTSQNPVHSFTPLAASTRSRLRLHSSESDSPVEKKPDPVTESASVAEGHVEDVALPVVHMSDKELEARIKKYSEGNLEAILPVLHAILQRMLAGEHDEADELRRKLKTHGFCRK
ncbi:hypothetical protein ES288_A13G246800v1 [Gossypium darwinii]|uniref:Uncharacterized protein n=1 Tax=Gossypium darwinii TaxID=34276 RepID=A0A5D2E3H6_GOSDA|nr:hypothetical protein ES288_A13G246800v1 [Gossypium darwinii]TYG87837.1 hypothetical protein ES288_A13G246800v1 [Gossypium darwinii]TYG87838.1 hypothetical protein ES288_A13G246800v1 [Gossypium darwinii]TYG87839.1 hypothetical protein ES288_A13G246800v1 [Gossypium darwinii]